MKKNLVQLNTSAFDDTKSEYHFKIDFYVYPKNDKYVSYCPSLDLTTTGENFNDAIGNFCECFQLYVECCIEAGTLWDDLQAHGWKFQKQEWKSPVIESLIKKQEMKDLLNSHVCFEKVVLPARIPAFA